MIADKIVLVGFFGGWEWGKATFFGGCPRLPGSQWLHSWRKL